MKTSEEIYAEYQANLVRWRERGAHYIDIRKLDTNEILFIKTKLHPTAKADSKKITKEIMRYVYEHKIVTADELFRDLGYSDKPVMKRLKIMRECGLIRRESKKYYMPSPRLIEIIERKWIEVICS